jgi:hypothetical protein
MFAVLKSTATALGRGAWFDNIIGGIMNAAIGIINENRLKFSHLKPFNHAGRIGICKDETNGC